MKKLLIATILMFSLTLAWGIGSATFNNEWVTEETTQRTITITNEDTIPGGIVSFKIAGNFSTNSEMIDITDWDPAYPYMNCYYDVNYFVDFEEGSSQTVNQITCNITSLSNNFSNSLLPNESTWVTVEFNNAEPEGLNYDLHTYMLWGQEGGSIVAIANPKMNYNVDLTPPVISINEPSSSESKDKQVMTSGSIIDGNYSELLSGLNRIEIKLNGNPNGEANILFPSGWNHNTKIIMPGQTTVTATAYDNAGNSAISEIIIYNPLPKLKPCYWGEWGRWCDPIRPPTPPIRPSYLQSIK